MGWFVPSHYHLLIYLIRFLSPMTTHMYGKIKVSNNIAEESIIGIPRVVIIVAWMIIGTRDFTNNI